MYVRSVRLTLMAPLSQLAAWRLAWSPLPMAAVLLEDGPDPAPSSKSVHGSISISLSCCNGIGLDFPVLVADRAKGTGFLWGRFRFPGDAPETEMLGWSDASAATGTDGGWQVREHRTEGNNIGMAAWIRHLTVSGSCMWSKSFCTHRHNFRIRRVNYYLNFQIIFIDWRFQVKGENIHQDLKSQVQRWRKRLIFMSMMGAVKPPMPFILYSPMKSKIKGKKLRPSKSFS